MDSPVKIIFKFKNDQSVYQYFLYIFIGKVPTELQKILNKIQNLDIINTLETLETKEIKILEEYYTENWHHYFFLSYNLDHSFKDLYKPKNKSILNKLNKKITPEKMKRMSKKINIKDQEAGELGLEEDEEEIDDEEVEVEIKDPYEKVDETKKETKKEIEVFEKVAKIHKEDIEEIRAINFDNSKNNLHVKDSLKLLFQKIYVTNFIIMPDDTILTIKKKICLSINNDKRYKFMIPSRQYLYSIKYDQTPLGHQWMRKGIPWDIPIIPLPQIEFYYNLNEETSFIKNMKSISSNFIRVEDQEDIILEDYQERITNNEIYLMDLYHELGDEIGIDEKQTSNLFDTYINIFYPKIKFYDVKDIISFLNNVKQNENNKLMNAHQRILKDITVQQQSIDVYHDIKTYENKLFKLLIKDHYITNTVVNWKSGLDEVNLQSIFDSFTTNDKYPFVQFQPKLLGSIVKINRAYARDASLQKKDNIKRWLQTTPYGLSFKVNMEHYSKNKYPTISILDSGNIEYRSQWSEADKMTVTKIKKTFQEVIDLIKIVNQDENFKTKFETPKIEEFKFSFINLIQTVENPTKKNIIYEELSNFASFFFPFVSIVSSKKLGTKHGTYLNYKRVSKYEHDVQAKMEYFITTTMEKYQYTAEELTRAVMKTFSINKEDANKEIESIKRKFTAIKRKTGKLKKMDDLPKIKTTGIKVDIQNKYAQTYIFRLTGVKSEGQLNRIINFLAILFYLYVEIFLKKNPEKQFLQKYLKEFAQVAKTRGQLEKIQEEAKDMKSNIKSLANLDKKRFGFIPDPGKSNYSRLCMKEGQPQGFQPKTVGELARLGYKYDEKFKTYIYPYVVKDGKKQETKYLKAIQLPSLDTGEDIYYVCHPKKNKDRTFIGILERDKHPENECMPCCYITDHSIATDPKKRKRFLECTQQKTLELEKKTDLYVYYILQDTNKIDEGRYGYLPNELNIFMNDMLKLTRKMKDHHHIDKTDGFFFKYGVQQDKDSFLGAIASCFKISISQVKKNIKNVLSGSLKDSIFASLNNGRAKLQFDDIKNYLEHVLENNTEEFKLLLDMLTVGNVLDPDGANIIIFQRNTEMITIKETNELKKIDDFEIVCQNIENKDYLFHPKRKTIFLLQEYQNFYPIFLFIKRKEEGYQTKRTFSFEDKPDNVVNHVYHFYKENCYTLELFKKTYNAKEIYHKIKKTEYAPEFQIINSYNKTIYFLTKNKFIIPTYQSGCLPNIKITDEKNIKNYLHNVLDTIKHIEKINRLYKLNIKLKYQSLNNNVVDYLVTEVNQYIPVTPSKKSGSLATQKYKSIDYLVDEEIYKGRTNVEIDKRILTINLEKYKNESYEILKLNFSEYLKRNSKVHKEVSESKSKISKYINEIIHVLKDVPDISKYEIENRRQIIFSMKKPGIHYFKQNNIYKVNVPKEYLNLFIEKLTNEMDDELKKKEILQQDGHYVSIIVDSDRITTHQSDIIIKTDNPNIQMVLSEIFQTKTPAIGKSRYQPKSNILLYSNWNKEFPVKYRKPFYIQKIYQEENPIFRAYSNGFYWHHNPHQDSKLRNLGYIHESQNKLSNYFKGLVIDDLSDKNPDYVKQLSQYDRHFSSGETELLSLNKLFKISIYLYDKYQVLFKVIDQKIYDKVPEKYNNNKIQSKSIHLRFTYLPKIEIPDRIDVMYYDPNL